MSNLALSPSNSLITPKNLDELKSISLLIASSGSCGAHDAKVFAVKILAGIALGLDPYTACAAIHVIKGQTCLSAGLQARFVKQHKKYDYHIVTLTDTLVEIEFFDISLIPKESLGISIFSWDDAKKAKLTNKDNWLCYPRNMLFSRAIVNGIRWFAPDIFAGATIYDPDELGYSKNFNDQALGDTTLNTSVIPDNDLASCIPFTDKVTAVTWASNSLGITQTEAESIYSKTAPDKDGKVALNFYLSVCAQLSINASPTVQ